MKRYFFYIRFIPETANTNLLVGRCLFILHGFIKKYQVEGLGVSFPNWTEESIGSTMAFVHCDIELLDKFKGQGYFQDMFDCGFFQISDISLVPSTCPEVKFKRNQRLKKVKPK